MKGNWLYLLVAAIALGGLITWIISIAPPHIFTQPKFYLSVGGEIVGLYGFVWLANRASRSRRQYPKKR